MSLSHKYKPNPKLDLVLERVIDVPRELVWRAWTTPALLKKWFTPAPWTTIDCEINLHPGGIFSTVMLSPDGEEYPHTGCYLEVIENEKLVWTDALGPDYRPAKGPFFTTIISLEPHEKGTKYTVIALHHDEQECIKHREMGFHEGWGKALEQLVELVKKM